MEDERAQQGIYLHTPGSDRGQPCAAGRRYIAGVNASRPDLAKKFKRADHATTSLLLQDMAAIALLDWTFFGPKALTACRPETFLVGAIPLQPRLEACFAAALADVLRAEWCARLPCSIRAPPVCLALQNWRTAAAETACEQQLNADATGRFVSTGCTWLQPDSNAVHDKDRG